MNQLFLPQFRGTTKNSTKRWFRLLIWGLWASIASFLLVSTQAQAYQARFMMLLKQGQQHQAYQWLLENQTHYAHDPRYNEWLASLALQFENYPLAINALERLILLEPNHLGARLDLAIAHLEAGDLENAQAHSEDLNSLFKEHNSIPEPALLALQQLRTQIAEQKNSSKPYRLRGLAQLTGAFDSNANLGPRDSTVTLNLQGAIPFELELAPESLPTEDYYLQQRAQIALEENKGYCLYQNWCGTLVADLRNRNYAELTQYDQQQMLLAGYLNHKGDGQQKRWLGYLQHSTQKGFDTETTLALEYSQSLDKYGYQLGYVIHGDTKSGSAATKGHQFSLSLFANDHQRFSYLVNAAYLDRPDRAAGNILRIQGSATYSRKLLNFVSRTSVGINWQRDSEPYSFLLFGPDPKTEIELSLSTSATWRLSPNWGVTLRASHGHTESNIPLLEHDRTEASATLTYLW